MANRAEDGGASDGGAAAEREVPLPGFNEITVEEAARRLRRLSAEKLLRVRAYEAAVMKRKTVLAAIDRLLEEQPPF